MENNQNMLFILVFKFLVIEIKLTLKDDNMYISIQPLVKFDGIKIELGEKLQWSSLSLSNFKNLIIVPM